MDYIDIATMDNKRFIIFIVGASRSGTTLMNRILDKNSHIKGTNETHYFGDLFDPYMRSTETCDAKNVLAQLFARARKGIWKGVPDSHDYKVADAVLKQINSDHPCGYELFEAYINWVAKQYNVRHVCEQTPRNIYYLSQLLSAYDNIRIIHMIRDPRAVVASQKRRWTRRRKLNARNIPIRETLREYFAYHPITMCTLWKRSVLVSQEIQSDFRYKQVRFEELIEHPEMTLKEICKFLCVPYESDMLDIRQIDSSIRNTNDNGVRKEALYAWKSVLNKGEIALIEYILHDEMNKYGYCHDAVNYFDLMIGIFYSILRYPIHIAGTILTDPRRVLIQIKGLIIRK